MLLIASFFLSSCQSEAEKNIEKNVEKGLNKPAIEHKKIYGISIYKKNFFNPQSINSSQETFDFLNKQITEDPLLSKTDLNITFSYSRLTIAGELDSTEQLDKIIEIALSLPEVQQIVSTVVVKGNQEERAKL
ncbi:MAG: BON domain-containing protein [Candidatus Caenarcaniphilales bacterium]|nr:BON domain-containing protein [Candidatus Caenarcaniphilales bacterium]